MYHTLIQLLAASYRVHFLASIQGRSYSVIGTSAGGNSTNYILQEPQICGSLFILCATVGVQRI